MPSLTCFMNTTSYITSKQQKVSTHLLTRCAHTIQTLLESQNKLLLYMCRHLWLSLCADQVGGGIMDGKSLPTMLQLSGHLLHRRPLVFTENFTVGRSNARSGSGSRTKKIYPHLSVSSSISLPVFLQSFSPPVLLYLYWSLYCVFVSFLPTSVHSDFSISFYLLAVCLSVLWSLSLLVSQYL